MRTSAEQTSDAKLASAARLKVVAFESRMADELRAMIERAGAHVLLAPAMQQVRLDEDRSAMAFAELLLAGKLDVVIFLTDVGIKTLLNRLEGSYECGALLAALGKTVTVVRGAKTARVLEELGLPATLSVPEPSTWRELLTLLSKRVLLTGKHVAIQEYGISNPDLIAGLEARGAHVRTVPVYRWALPGDRALLLKALAGLLEGTFDVALFTSAAQVRHLMQLAGAQGVEDQLCQAMHTMVISSIGPVCSEAVRRYGLAVDIEPSRPKLEHLVEDTLERAPQILRDKRRQHIEVRPAYTVAHERPAGAYKASGLASPDHPLMKACRGEPTPYTPIWLMRQAGRYLPEYRRVRERVGFIEMCRKSELAAEVTVSAVKRLGVDAAIIFSDLLLPLLPMDVGLRYEKGDGPIIERPIRTLADLHRITRVDAAEALSFTAEAIKLARAALGAKTPIIGFAGAPFTLASYLVEGGASRQYLRTKRMMYNDEAAWTRLMELLARLSAECLNLQIAAGADLVQLFDSWVGNLAPDDYERYVLPHTAAVIKAIPAGVPVIHFGTDTGNLLSLMRKAGGDVIGLDWRVDLAQARQRLGADVAVQGNLDPAALLASIPELREKARRILAQVGGHPGHIFNLGHGILPETPVDHVVALVDAVHEMSVR
jgi:uroporphyrinogen decarboxylase